MAYDRFFPISVIISSLSSEVDLPITWLFRQLYILGGFAFFISLFQFQANQKTHDRVLLVIVIATGLHGLLGTLQTFDVSLAGWLSPNSSDNVPRGNFQQVNVHISFLVTGLITTLYFISRPSFKNSGKLISSIVVASSSIAIYVIVASGSRIGLLSMILAIPILGWSRFEQLKRNKKLLASIFIIGFGGTTLGYSGLSTTLDKTAQLSEKSYSVARIAMYTVGLELITKEPLHGHGVGGFLKAWNKQSSDFYKRNPRSELPVNVGHPHNEILFWMIEGGLLAVGGIVVFAIGLFIALYHCGWQRGGAYVAMLLPISLHTQVELPFHVSSLHWFIWLFLIYLVLRHRTKVRSINLSQAAIRLIQLFSIVFAFSTTLFMVNTARAQADLYDFLYNKNAQPPYLEVALNNLYFKPYAEKVAMRSNLYANIEKGNRQQVEQFIVWAKDYVSKSPELKMYEDLISASAYLNPEGKGCDMIREALAMYAHNKPLQRAIVKCQ